MQQQHLLLTHGGEKRFLFLHAPFGRRKAKLQLSFPSQSVLAGYVWRRIFHALRNNVLEFVSRSPLQTPREANLALRSGWNWTVSIVCNAIKAEQTARRHHDLIEGQYRLAGFRKQHIELETRWEGASFCADAMGFLPKRFCGLVFPVFPHLRTLSGVSILSA